MPMPESEMADWQIPCSLRGTFTIDSVPINEPDAYKPREFSAQIVNINPNNTRFFVRLTVRDALVPFEWTGAVHITHGSGVSADHQAVLNAITAWLGPRDGRLVVLLDKEGN